MFVEGGWAFPSQSVRSRFRHSLCAFVILSKAKNLFGAGAQTTCRQAGRWLNPSREQPWERWAFFAHSISSGAINMLPLRGKKNTQPRRGLMLVAPGFRGKRTHTPFLPSPLLGEGPG